MKTILITGVAGFIGYNLALKLIKKYKVIGIDNFNNSSSKRLKALRIKKLESKNFIFFKKDILDLNQKFDVDYVYHLAAVKLNDSKDNSRLIIKNNILTIYKLINLINKKNLKKIIFSSSLYVYGNFKKEKSEKSKCKPENNYGKSKLRGEKIFIKKFYNLKKVDLTIFRIFFTFGNKQYSKNNGYPSVIYKNLYRLINNKRPIIYNDGNQILDYSHIDYVTNVLQTPIKIKMNGIYNLCSNNGISIYELIKKMKKLFLKSKKPIFMGRDNTKNTIKLGSNKKLKNKIKIVEKYSIFHNLKKIKNSLLYEK